MNQHLIRHIARLAAVRLYAEDKLIEVSSESEVIFTPEGGLWVTAHVAVSREELATQVRLFKQNNVPADVPLAGALDKLSHEINPMN